MGKLNIELDKQIVICLISVALAVQSQSCYRKSLGCVLPQCTADGGGREKGIDAAPPLDRQSSPYTWTTTGE